MHTGWKSREGGSWIFCKNPFGGRGQGFQERLQGGGTPYFGFLCIFINKCFEICLGGVLYLTSPFPPHPPLPRVHLWLETLPLKTWTCQHATFTIYVFMILILPRQMIPNYINEKLINLKLSVSEIRFKILNAFTIQFLFNEKSVNRLASNLKCIQSHSNKKHLNLLSCIFNKRVNIGIRYVWDCVYFFIYVMRLLNYASNANANKKLYHFKAEK